MNLLGLHILLTYRCLYECAHCFVWGSPRQSGTLTLEQIEEILRQARDAEVEWIYFEGGEPFLYYAVLAKGVCLAAEMGFSVGVVSNAYWANSVADAIETLQPFADCLDDFAVSSDPYHCGDRSAERAQNALMAAKWLGIPSGVISIAQPGCRPRSGEGELMYRGRAVHLAAQADLHPWEQFTECPYEDLREPGRVHVDPFGRLHICQGLVIGNLFERALSQICAEYDPETHPICCLLLAGGPAALVRGLGLPHASAYADACHLCYEARSWLRSRFPALLGPDQMYGVTIEDIEGSRPIASLSR